MQRNFFNNSTKFILLLPVFSLIISCATTNMAPIHDLGRDFELAEDEHKIWEDSEKLETMIFEKGMLYNDPELTAYVNGVGQKLIPEGVEDADVKFNFLIIRDSSLNAFAFPNGGIYIHTGLLAQLENEAQLAFILAHEMTHVTERHQVAFVRSLKNKTMVYSVVDILGTAAMGVFGVYGSSYAGLFGLGTDLFYASTVTGFGRNKERSADEGAMELMYSAGYQVGEAPKIFQILLEERKDPSKMEVFFYGSHPACAERLQTTETMLDMVYDSAQNDSSLIRNAEGFQKQTCLLLRKNAALDIKVGRYRHAIRGLEKFLERSPQDPLGHYYLGEVHRLILKHPDKLREEEEAKGEMVDKAKYVLTEEQKREELGLAKDYYGLAMAYDENLAEPHKGLGLLYLFLGDKEMAKEELEKYLELKPEAKDKRFIQSRIKKCDD